MEREKGILEKAKLHRTKIENILIKEKISFSEWTIIKNHIDQKYEEIKGKSTL